MRGFADTAVTCPELTCRLELFVSVHLPHKVQVRGSWATVSGAACETRARRDCPEPEIPAPPGLEAQLL
ncbi:hypothetical protein GCM10015535_68160 [Streptomyces gelaticus]|uniref:Uncharacterized protein n=1 Tax=Streptomyces gelaticus TaxID=285446 RepID=A0ABQ2W9V8_9ACTN|nr:hypothetical protein GCM10015535_68160 [Streptomyces gelaticus]